MKYLFILISFLSFIQFSLAAEKAYTLQSGDASLSVVKDGKRLSLQTGNAHYLSLNAPYVVTLEVNAETLNGYSLIYNNDRITVGGGYTGKFPN